MVSFPSVKIIDIIFGIRIDCQYYPSALNALFRLFQQQMSVFPTTLTSIRALIVSIEIEGF